MSYAWSVPEGGDPATRLRILEAGRKLLERRAGAPVSIGAVASAAGVSRQAAYLHFGSRAQLFCEIARHVDAVERAPEQPRVDDAPSGGAALEAAVRLQAKLKPRLQAAASALDALRRTDEAAQEAWNEREHARLSRCRQVMQRLADEGALAREVDVATGAQLMWALTSLRVWEDLVVDQGWTSERYVREIVRSLERSLLAPARPRRRARQR